MTSLRQRTILPLRGTSGALWFTLVARLCGLHSAAAAAAQKKKKKRLLDLCTAWGQTYEQVLPCQRAVYICRFLFLDVWTDEVFRRIAVCIATRHCRRFASGNDGLSVVFIHETQLLARTVHVSEVFNLFIRMICNSWIILNDRPVLNKLKMLNIYC